MGPVYSRRRSRLVWVSMRLCMVTLYLVGTCLLICPGVQGIRVKRTECRTVMEQYNHCAQRSYLAYQSAFTLGDDGRPDWLARKSCNYITSSLDVCPGHLRAGGCKTEEEITQMKDKLMAATLKQVVATVESWHSHKCPAVRSYMERLGILPQSSSTTSSDSLLPAVSGDFFNVGGEPEVVVEAEEVVEAGQAQGESNCECFMDSMISQIGRLTSAWNAFAEAWNAM